MMNYKEREEWSENIESRNWRDLARMVREYTETPDEKQGMTLQEWLADCDDPDTAYGETTPKQVARTWDAQADRIDFN